MKRRDLLTHLGTLGTLGVSRALLPAWLPQLAFRFNGDGEQRTRRHLNLYLSTRR